jgi:uncharacterized zinc-type alcohol dehydrogenase-like protein
VIEFEPVALARGELRVAVEKCALCHSDLHLIDGDWPCDYPLVPGHEIVGRVLDVGSKADSWRLGSRVGVGWQRGCCERCAACASGLQHLCSEGKRRTCVGQQGGFAEVVDCDAAFAYPIPESIRSADAAPLMCAGLTVFSALERLVTRPGMRVGIIGAGGLGHLAIQFAAKMGCEVTAFDVVRERLEHSLRLGASAAFPVDIEPRGNLDLLLSTTSADLKWDAWLNHLDLGGTMCLVGYPSRPIGISPAALLDGQRVVTGSVIGSPATMLRMLAFAAANRVVPVVEELPMSRAGDAVKRLRANEARYRIVLDMDL